MTGVQTCALPIYKGFVGKNKERPEKGAPKNPNILNKSLIAFSTVADGIDYASKSLLNTGSQAATVVVAHKYGAEAGDLAKAATGSVKNVGLVYIDASGVSRRAVVKGVAKGMVVGKVRGGGEVMVATGSGQGYTDGLPPGWGDGPLGGANAGPPQMHRASTEPPPGYETGSVQGGTVYYPPPARTPSPGYGKTGGKSGTFRF